MNALLPPTSYVRRRKLGVTFLSDHTDFDGPVVQAALSAYVETCGRALQARDPKPRRILDLIRLAAEIAGAPDPVWSPADHGEPYDRTDLAFNRLYRRTEQALKAGGLV